GGALDVPFETVDAGHRQCGVRDVECAWQVQIQRDDPLLRAAQGDVLDARRGDRDVGDRPGRGGIPGAADRQRVGMGGGKSGAVWVVDVDDVSCCSPVEQQGLGGEVLLHVVV